MIDSTVPLHLRGDFEVSIGSDPGCDAVLPGLAPVHAKFKRTGDRLFIKTLLADGSTSINRDSIKPNRWIEVTRYDEVVIGGTLLSISPKFFLGRDRVGLDTTPLTYVLPGAAKRTLCDGVYLRAKPGTFTAILGPAGCGKTLFLSLLNGYLAPNTGQVIIADNFDPRRDHRILRDFIGYVPQDDILIPELTVRQSLNYRLGLKFPDMSEFSKDRLIKDTCRLLGLDGKRTAKFLDTMIGAPDSRRRGLSGGERKRANLAHELITKPLILILDEPTSGLSSADADQIVQLLKGLAREELLTVIATVHQPSARAFGLFDDLLVMSFGGRPAYYGPAGQAVRFFEQAASSSCGTLNPAEFILETVVESPVSPHLDTSFRKSRPAPPDVPAPLSGPGEHVPPPGRRQPPKGEGMYNWLHQWLILTRRNLAVLLTDKTYLALNLLQAPLIALLILGAFHGAAQDTEKSDVFARTIYEFGLLKAPYEKQDLQVPVDRLIAQAATEARNEKNRVGPIGAQRRGAVYFILVAASIWFGTLGACREIVGEQHILKREIRTCVNLMPYLGSKALVQVLLTGVQTGLLVLIVNQAHLQLGAIYAAKLWFILWLVAIASASLGLLVSCLAPTYRVALTAVPILMIPQLLFGGMMRPPVEIAPGYYWPKAVSAITIQYWGFQSVLEVVSPVEKVMLKEILREGNWDRVQFEGRGGGELNIVVFNQSDLAGAFFPTDRSTRPLQPFLPLVLVIGACLALGYVVLRLKFL
jgi:ABC-type multidrug transport system ATPase subunit/ABC-type multidrug transport system permease subunit